MDELNPTQSPEGASRRVLFWSVGAAAILLVGLVIFVFAAIVLERGRSPMFTPSRMQASVIVALSPEVQIKSTGSQNFDAVVGVVPVEAGTEVRTSPAAKAFLFSPNGALTVIKENTHLTIAELDEQGNRTRLALVRGTIRARVERLLQGTEYYEVESGGIVTSIRGTEFEVERIGTSSVITVVRNEVALTALGVEADSGRGPVVARLASGERIAISADTLPDENVESLKETLSRAEMEALISDGIDAELAESRAALTAGEAAVSAGLPGSLWGGVERFAEAIGTAATRGNEAKALRNLALAEERLAEARLLAREKDPAVSEAIADYQRLLSRALSSNAKTNDVAVRELLARSTLAHQEIFSLVLANVPEEARSAVLQAQVMAQQGHSEAVEVLGSIDPQKALSLGIESMREDLRAAQEESVRGNSFSTFEALYRFDRMTRLVSELMPDTEASKEQALYADELRKSLTVIETLDTLASALLPGISISVDEVRTRSIKNQLASIAALAVEDPQEAVNAYAKTADYYLERLAEKTRSDKKDADKLAEAFLSYAQFGDDMASLAGGLRDGTTNIRTLVERATAHHEEVLSGVKNKVPEAAKPAIERAISASAAKLAIPERALQADEFRERRAMERPKEDLLPQSFDVPVERPDSQQVAPPRMPATPPDARNPVIPQSDRQNSPPVDRAPQPTTTPRVPQPATPSSVEPPPSKNIPMPDESPFPVPDNRLERRDPSGANRY